MKIKFFHCNLQKRVHLGTKSIENNIINVETIPSKVICFMCLHQYLKDLETILVEKDILERVVVKQQSNYSK